MRKEVLFAILAGVFFGLIIAFGLWRLNSTLAPSDDTQTEASPTPVPEFSITIAEPGEGQVVTESPTLITGITKPNSFVIASTEDEDFMAKADEDGGFEIEVEVVGGINQVLAASIDKTGKIASVEITIAHSTELSANEEEQEQEESTESSDTIRQKVQDKVEQAKTVPHFYMGTVTDIAEGTIQIRTSSGEIKQVSTAEDETTYVSLVNDREEVEFSDVAIGDFLVAMGFKNSNEVLDAQRVLVTTPPGEIGRAIVAGNILEIFSGEVVIEKEGEQEITLDFPRVWKGPDLDELAEGEMLIAVGEADGNTISIRSIFQIQEESEE
jgi:hypothetical protein